MLECNFSICFVNLVVIPALAYVDKTFGYSSYNKSHRDARFLRFILVKISTSFGQIYRPSLGGLRKEVLIIWIFALAPVMVLFLSFIKILNLYDVTGNFVYSCMWHQNL
jgi:hypothetical protein